MVIFWLFESPGRFLKVQFVLDVANLDFEALGFALNP